MVGLRAEMYGAPCMNPKEHGKATNKNGFTVLLNDKYTGCDATLGANPYANQILTEATSYSLGEFYKDNSKHWNKNAVGAVLDADLKDENSVVQLYSMHRIEMACDNNCQGYKLGTVMTNLETQMKDAYADLKVIIYVSAIGGGLALIYCLYLVWKRSQATQDEYVQFWGLALVVLIIVTIMMCMFVVKMSRRYNANRNMLPVIKNCITNSSWKKLTDQLYKGTNMTAEHNWAITWLTFGILLVLVMLYMMMTVAGQLERLSRPEEMY